MGKTYLVFFCEEMEQLALALAENKKFQLGLVNWKHFPDGTPNIYINNYASIEDKNIIFLASFSKAIHKFDQLAVIMTICEGFPKSLIIVLPYYPTATMERVEIGEEGQVATANIDAWLFNSLPSIGKTIKLIVYDLHTLQNRFYVKGNCLIKIESMIPTFISRLKENHDKEKIIIAFPDEGAYKRFKTFFESEYEIIVCNKKRSGDNREIAIMSGENILNENLSEDTNIFIVDDLVQSGTTLIECKNALISAGAKKVSVFVTHVVFPKNSWEKILGENFDKFYYTDTFPKTSNNLQNKNPFEKISLYDNIKYIL